MFQKLVEPLCPIAYSCNFFPHEYYQVVVSFHSSMDASSDKMVSELAPEGSADCYIVIVVFDWLFLVVPLLRLL
jgi:hypothetical protein